MSWTVEQTNKNKEDIKLLDAQVQRAATANILMYCACRDGAWNEKQKGPYPSASDTLKIRRIGSSDPDGHLSSWVNPDSVDYLFPGESLSQGDNSYGSSASTAFASGLAAMILWCFMATGESIDDIRTPEKMKMLFDSLDTRNKYINVVSLFESVSERQKREKEGKIKAFVKECKAKANML